MFAVFSLMNACALFMPPRTCSCQPPSASLLHVTGSLLATMTRRSGSSSSALQNMKGSSRRKEWEQYTSGAN